MRNRNALRAPTCTLSCPCGAPIIVDGRRPEGVQTCVVCRQALKIVVATDPRTRKRRIGILVSPQAVTAATRPVRPAAKREATKSRARSAPLAGIHNPKCACGARVPVNLSAVDAVYTCPWCGACYTALAKRDARTGVSVPLLMPVEMVPVEAPAKKPEGAFHMTPEVIGAQPLKTRDARACMSCFCGREMEVDPDAPTQDRKCPACGLSFQLVLAVEPGTHRPMVITLPRSKAAAKEKTA